MVVTASFVSILIAAVAGAGRCFGWQPPAKVSMMIMRPPRPSPTAFGPPLDFRKHDLEQLDTGRQKPRGSEFSVSPDQSASFESTYNWKIEIKKYLFVNSLGKKPVIVTTHAPLQ